MTNPASAFSRLAGVALAAALAAGSAGCLVGTAGGYYDGSGYPPDAYIATAEPYYYEGHPVYWYGGRWSYRDGRRWRHYEHEPPVLYQRRIQAPPARRAYEPARARPAGRGSWHRYRSR